MEKNSILKKILSFKKEVFYVVLFLCFCILAVTFGYRSGNSTRTAEKVSKNVANTQQIANKAINPILTKDKVNSLMTSKQQGKSIKDKTIKLTKAKKVPLAKSAKLPYIKNFKLSFPVKGKILKKFDNIELQYSKPMGQWETHEGIDIACDLGTEVKAALGGRVIEIIKTDDTLTTLGKDGFGDGIVIDHGNGYRTEYLNLSIESLKLKKGDFVKVGQTIGNIGDTSLREDISIEGSHLHFDVLKKSGKIYENVNPLLFLK